MSTRVIMNGVGAAAALLLTMVAVWPAVTAAAEFETVNVGPALVDCVGVGPMKCMVVDDEYFYDEIEGFDYEEGYEYELEIKKTERTDVPADASSYEYELVKVVHKIAIADNELLDVSEVVLERLWQKFDMVIAAYIAWQPWQVAGGGTLTFSDDRISANTGCNSIGAPYSFAMTELTVGPVVSTKRACLVAADMEREADFIAALSVADTLKLTTTGVEISGDAGTITLTR